MRTLRVSRDAGGRMNPFTRYGRKWPGETRELAIELWAYQTGLTVDEGGLGPEAHFRRAFKLAWPKFIWHEWMEMLMTAFCNEKIITVIGHARATKTYGVAHLLYLDYCAAPLATWTSLTTVTFDGLKGRMWSDLMAAVESATFGNPFKISSTSNEMKLRLVAPGHRAEEKYMIEGFATSKQRDAAGRIQGKHAARRRLGLDEAQELPDVIFQAEVNAGTAPDFKSIRLANPVDKETVFGRECCEPAGGWGTVHDSDLWWRTKAGRIVLHFDGLQCFNAKLYIRLGRGAITRADYEAKKLPFMLTQEYIEEVRLQHTEESLEWWMYIRGFFPPDGIVSRVFPSLLLERMQADVTFDFPPVGFAVLDPAYEHDNCVLHFGVYGTVRDGLVSFTMTATVVVPVKVSGTDQTKDEQIAEFVQAACEARGIKAENYIQDMTGNGRSVWSHLSKNWGRAVQGVEFGGKPTDRPLIYGEAAKCDERFRYFVDELHFRAAAWAASGRAGGLGRLAKETIEDLAARRYTVVDQKQRVESKAEIKKRLGRSPDYGDAYILAGELMARKGHMPGKTTDVPRAGGIWAAAKIASVDACARYGEEAEFSYF